MLLIGSAPSGPLYSPTYISEPKEIDQYFGGRLARAYRQAYYAGAPAIWVVRIPAATSFDELYISLQEAYDRLISFKADIVVPIDAYANVPLSLVDAEGRQATFARQLAAFCHMSWTFGSYKLGILPTILEPGADYEELLAMPREYDIGTPDAPVDAARYIGIAGLSVKYSDTNGSYDDSPAISIAASMLAQEPVSGLTNISVPWIASLPYQYPPKVHRRLAQAGIMTVCNSVRKGHVLYQAVTCSQQPATRSFTSMRIVANVLGQIQEATDKYLGEYAGRIIDGATLEQQIEAVLENHHGLRDYQYTVTQDQDTYNLELSLCVRGEIASIATLTQLVRRS